MEKFCDHIEYDRENKTYHLKARLNIDKEQVGTCSECGVVIDVEPLKSGDQQITNQSI